MPSLEIRGKGRAGCFGGFARNSLDRKPGWTHPLDGGSSYSVSYREIQNGNLG
jgi:hypothetical protein